MTHHPALPSEQKLIDQLRGKLVVSCQAPDGHPLRDPQTIARIAECAALGGAAALRINSPQDIVETRMRGVDLPIIGLWKISFGHRSAITTTFDHAKALVDAGADIVAIEATSETADGLEVIERTRSELRVPVMADVSAAHEGIAAWEAGATFVGTTLSGYTRAQLPTPEGPDMALVTELVAAGIRTAAEGRFATPAEVTQALELGAHYVVVGRSITDPLAITRRFASAAKL